MRRVVRVLSALVLLAGILATHPVRLSGACSAGVVTSPQGLYDAKEPSTSGDGRDSRRRVVPRTSPETSLRLSRSVPAPAGHACKP